MRGVWSGMNAPLERYDVYRVVTDYEALIEALRDRVDDMNISREDVDAAGDLQPGYASKLLSDPPIKNLGIKGFSGLLKATGMSLVMVVDPERAAKAIELTKPRKIVGGSAIQIRKKAALSIPLSIVESHETQARKQRMQELGRKGGKRRMKTMTRRARQRVAAHAARMRWAKAKA